MLRGRMEEQIRFIAHNGCRVLLIDVSNCTPEQISKLCQLVPSYVSAEPRGSVLLLADFSGATFNKEAVASLKEATVYVRPHLKRSAWVGVETLPKVFYQNIKSFSQRDLPTFKSRREALDWLTQDSPA
ncbi:MAG TPA: hypothetical protein VJO35_04920 [Terriglobales bacterium]|nr:hypothetical protein [Terriglobales bacterium]